MPKINIYYQDLNLAKQEEIRQLVREDIIKDWCEENNIDPNDYFESELTEKQIEEIDEKTDDYINEHNLVNEYSI